MSKWKTGKYVFNMWVPKPKVPKTESQKKLRDIFKEARETRGKSKKEHQDTMNTLFKTGAYWRRRGQQQKGEKITKSGVSKGKDKKD